MDIANNLVVVLENIYQTHNANSVIRTCENLGVKNLYVIESLFEFKPDQQLSYGAVNHINIHRFKNSLECLNGLKKDGFTIIATTPHKDDFDLEEMPIKEKMAIFFGSEENGLSDDIINNSDIFMKVPMYGFTESLNISVCVALTLFSITNRMRNLSVE